MKTVTPFGRINRSLSPSWEGRNWMNRFDNFFNEMEKNMKSEMTWPEARLGDSLGFSPLVDVEENDDMFLISVDLPGLKKENIKIDVSGNVLTISGERTKEIKTEGYCERAYGRFARSFDLPENIDAKKVEAGFEDGVLRLVLPKSEVKTKQEIKIQAGAPREGLIERFLHRDKTAKENPEMTKEKDKH